MHVGVSGDVHHVPPQASHPRQSSWLHPDIGGRIDERLDSVRQVYEELRESEFLRPPPNDLATLTLPVKKMNRWQLEQLCHLVFASCDGGNSPRIEYFGMRSSKTLMVAGKPSDSLRMHGFPAARDSGTRGRRQR